jgi:hypothetical protein
MAHEKINKAFELLIFRVVAEPVPLSFVEMYFRSPAVMLQSLP